MRITIPTQIDERGIRVPTFDHEWTQPRYHDDGTVTVELTGEAAERYRRSRVVRKTDIYRRMTDAEAATLRALEDDFRDQEPKLYYLWSVPELRFDDAMFPVLVGVFEETFGEQRAAELLAPWEGM